VSGVTKMTYQRVWGGLKGSGPGRAAPSSQNGPSFWAIGIYNGQRTHTAAVWNVLRPCVMMLWRILAPVEVVEGLRRAPAKGWNRSSGALRRGERLSRPSGDDMVTMFGINCLYMK
jgi:hypothetical protein